MSLPCTTGMGDEDTEKIPCSLMAREQTLETMGLFFTCLTLKCQGEFYFSVYESYFAVEIGMHEIKPRQSLVWPHLFLSV